MKRILVTGSSGFIGLNLLECLDDKEFDVYSTARVPDEEAGELSVHLDLENPSTILAISERHQFDAFVHLASSIGWSGASYEDMFISNVIATGMLGRVAKKMGAQFIFASAALIHGKTSQEVSDSTPVRLDTDYARSKYDAEQLLKAIIPEACILRIGGVFGHKGPEHLGINRAISEALDGNRPVQQGEGRSLRNYIFVEDLGRLIIKVIQEGITGTHLVAGLQAQSIKNMLDVITNECGLPSPIVLQQNTLTEAPDQLIIPSSIVTDSVAFRSAIEKIVRRERD